MHACLLHIYNHAFTLFVLIVIYPKKLVMAMREQCYLNRDRSFVVLTSRIRLYPVSCFKALEWYLNCWQIACCSYMSFYWLSSRKYGTVWYHPASSMFYLTIFILWQFQENWLARFGSGTCFKRGSACCVLGARCRFCINTLFGTPGETILADSRCLAFTTSWMSPWMTCLWSSGYSWRMPSTSSNKSV
jgi:hypothetical protein